MCEDSQNPYCLADKPTDPYNWIFWAGVWYYAQDFTGQAQPSTLYKVGNQFYFCTANCTGSPGASGASGFDLVTGANSLYAYGATCPPPIININNVNTQLSNYAPVPNARTGACERTALNDPCANPCIRLENGTLAVNANSGSCRVFPNVTSGGNASFLGNTCPTVCPSACVELWETCPPGTGPLTTLAQTKTSTDIMSLTGPYRLDSSPNALWPTNYASNRQAQQSQAAAPGIFGKPYTECYAYNTEFCDLPMGWQKSVISLSPPSVQTQCFSSCPQGTFPDKEDPSTCRFLPDNPNLTAEEIDANTPVQKVFCNPQYFNPVYWPAPYGGIQKGCQSRGLPSKQGSSCLQGTSPLVNEFFNLEWCVPDCPIGYFFDLSQSTCVATCQGTGSSDSIYNAFLDYVDFYATSNRCLPGTNCIQNDTPGRCPSKSTEPINSRLVSLTNFDPGSLSSSNASNSSSASNSADCPPGMAGGVPGRNENANYCYDVCQSGYEPVSFCANGQPTCDSANRIFSCRAQCPSHREGLGPWTANNNNPIFTCSYNYPGNVVPADPNLWVQCPDDGRYTVLTTNSINDTTLSTVSRTEPLCIRKSYLRRSTCPLGFTEVGTECISSCNANDALVTQADGSRTCQSSSAQSSRHDLDLNALSDSNTQKAFKNRLLTRKAFSRGLGSDPNSGVSDSNNNSMWLYIGLGIGIAIVLRYILLQIGF